MTPLLARIARPWSILSALALCGVPLAAQVPGVSREQMWPAPTEEDWAKPCLITWERTFEDAARASRETGKPILICVNMDGEIASEHYAGIRYRQPEITELYAPYVTVIASVYRHTPRDYDEEGRRILCPRFGSVTCGEHIAIEPGLYDKYFEGQRVAPRHIMIELDGAETYDVFYAFDTASVFEAIRTGITEREYQPPPDTLSDRPLLERVTSPRNRDQTELEAAYLEGDRSFRREVLQRILRSKQPPPVDVLRLAVFGLDLEMARLARQGLAEATSPAAIDLISEALRVPMEEAERSALIAALERIGKEHPRARTLAAAHRGLAGRSESVDVSSWSRALRQASVQVDHVPWEQLESRLVEGDARSLAQSYDGEARLQLAEASLALALDPETAEMLAQDPRTRQGYSKLMYEDAYRTAREAQVMGVEGWRLDTALALSAFYSGKVEESYEHAERAVRALPPGEPNWNSMAVLSLFAKARENAIWRAVRAEEEWPPEWLTDVNDTYAVLAEHPMATDDQIVAHHDFLRWFKAKAPAERVLQRGLERFPDSWALHDRLRGATLREHGVEGLEEVYEEMLGALDASPNLPWFAGYAMLTAAEYRRRAGENDAAEDSYARALEFYELGIERNPETRESADHYAALALAGRARLALERRAYEEALEGILASFERGPLAAASLDGLQITPVMTANTLLARLEEVGLRAEHARLQEALDGLDPRMHIPPVFELESRGRGPGGQRIRRGGGRGRGPGNR